MNMMLSGELQPFSLRVEDYLLLDSTGAFRDKRVELIEGMIVAVSPEGRSHGWLKNELMYRWRLMLRSAGFPYEAFVEPTLSLPPHNMPEPDVLIARTDASGAYFELVDVVLAIEVGASTLRTDLGVKKAMYAGQRVPEYWVVDVERGEVHRFWHPDGDDYGEHDIRPLAGELRSATMPDLAIDASGIL